MSIEVLRAVALARNSERKFDLTLCFDDKAATEYREAVERADKIKAEINSGEAKKKTRTMAEKQVDPVAEAEAEVERLAEALPKDKTLIVRFRPVSPAVYESLLMTHSDHKGQIDFRGFYPALLAECYESCRSLDDDDLEINWTECSENVLTGQDYDNAIAGCVALHRTAQDIPFDRPNSGSARQN